jgi:hypothetical protein
MKEFVLSIERYLYTARTTIGKLYFLYDGFRKEYFCYTLEDTCRPGNIKVYQETALPSGLKCDVSLFENDHFKKTIIFHTEPDNFTIKIGILSWTYCLAHNGNSFDDTAGCVLVGANLIPAIFKNDRISSEPTIYNPMKEALRTRIEKAISDGYAIKAQFSNADQLK